MHALILFMKVIFYFKYLNNRMRKNTNISSSATSAFRNN